MQIFEDMVREVIKRKKIAGVENQKANKKKMLLLFSDVRVSLVHCNPAQYNRMYCLVESVGL